MLSGVDEGSWGAGARARPKSAPDDALIVIMRQPIIALKIDTFKQLKSSWELEAKITDVQNIFIVFFDNR